MIKRHARELIAVLAIAVVAFAITAVRPVGAEVAMAPPKIPTHGLLFGASVESSGGLDYRGQLSALETQLGRTLAIDRSFARWDDAQPTALVTDDLANGRVPLLSISGLKRDGTKLAWASIAAGSYDADIVRQADALRGTGRPMILAFAHEADILTGYGTAADFRAAFQHYVSVYRAEGASNVAFALILTPHGYDHAADWYPGASYVDWLGTDAYNFGSCKSGVSGWHSLQYAAQPFYDWAAKTGKPLVLAEFGSADDTTNPDHRAQWLRDAATTLASWPAIKAAAYFDRPGTCDWRVGSSGPAFDALGALARSPLANGRPTAGVVASVPVGPTPLTTTLTLARSTGGESATGTGVARWTLDFGDGTSTSGVGQPTQVTHTYAVGTWTPKASVTDSGGRIASATTKIISAGPPVVAQADPVARTTTSATVPGWINTSSLAGSYYVEWGLDQTYGHRSADYALAAKGYDQAVKTVLDGLTPGVKYHWRTVAVTPAGTTKGHDRTFTL